VNDVEPRRIKKLVRKLRADKANALRDAADSRRALREERTYALTKLRTKPFITERGIQAQLARIWVRNAKIKRPGERWLWKTGSKELARVRNVLGLKP
jgi:hypothetical protein